MTDVKLPELPKADHRFQDPEGEQADIHVFTIDTLQTYARAAVELNRVVVEGVVPVPLEMVNFLLGERPLDDTWFGERPGAESNDGKTAGLYWWRRALTRYRYAALTAALAKE